MELTNVYRDWYNHNHIDKVIIPDNAMIEIESNSVIDTVETIDVLEWVEIKRIWWTLWLCKRKVNRSRCVYKDVLGTRYDVYLDGERTIYYQGKE